VLAAVLFAGWRSRHVPVLLWYFISQAVYAVVVFPAGRLLGDTSVPYSVIYAILTGIVLASVVRIAWNTATTRQNSWRAAAIVGVLAITVGHVAFKELDHPARYYDWIGIVEASVLFWAALVIGATAPYIGRWKVAFTLALLWFGQAWFRYGFYTHLPDKFWLTLNWRVPPLLCITGFILIGRFLGHEMREMRQGHTGERAALR
jgi:hypothetical protein